MCFLSPIDAAFKPFILDGVVSVSDTDLEPKPVHILKDTEALKSIIMEGVHPLSNQSSCGKDDLVERFSICPW